MVHIGPPNTPVSTPKIKKLNSRGAAVAGSQINKDAPHVQQELQQDRRRREKDRRQRAVKPLIELRTGRDRRDDPETPKIDIEV